MNKEKIIDLYTKENKSTYEIADLFNTYPNKIRRILISSGIEIKDKSQAQKNALLKGTSKIPTQGLQRTKEEKLKISAGTKKAWDNLSEEEYNARVDKAKEKWKNMSDVEKANMLSSAIKAIQIAGKEGSKLEKYLKTELSKGGYKIEFHKKDLIVNHNLEIDIYVPRLKTIIEIDGPSHFLPIWGDEKLQKQIRADAHKTGLILSKGLAIIRVKHLSDTVSLSSKENLKNTLLDILNKIEHKFPPKDERYIELEI
jgi:very-short-patch-repair endonuclease